MNNASNNQNDTTNSDHPKTDRTESAYLPAQTVMNDEDKRRNVWEQAEKDLRGLEKKYRGYVDIAELALSMFAPAE